MVGPVLPVVGHLKLLDYQNVQMGGALHGMENVEQAMLLASCCWGEDGTLQQCRVLETYTEDQEDCEPPAVNINHQCFFGDVDNCFIMSVF